MIKYFLYLLNLLTGGAFRYLLEQLIMNKLENLDDKKAKEFSNWYLNSDIKKNVEKRRNKIEK